MTGDHWQRVKALFQAAVEQPAAERDAFLSSAAGDDQDLRREVESLLVADEAHASFLEEVRVSRDAVLADLADGRHVLPGREDQPRGSPGRRIGPYEIIDLVGAGAMGEVYRAHDTKLKRDVALKVLPPLFAFEPDRLARFRREAQVLAALNHPHIGAIYGFEDSTGVHALVLELVDGPTLADRLAAARLPVAEALAIAGQIAEAVEAAHEKGIIHRDLKPANIKIDASGTVKVLDFGLAKAIGSDTAPPNLTASHDGLILGTASYMSPEQTRGQPLDKRVDVWAFGCVLYEMLTGQLAFPGATVSDTIARILEREPDWSLLPADTPVSVRRLLVRCLVKDPRRRLRDMGDIRIEIDAVDDESPGGLQADRAGLPARLPRRGPRSAPPPRSWMPWLAVAAIAIAAGLWEAGRSAPSNENPLANARFSRFTDWEGAESGAQISPDGRFVAFMADRDGEFDIWLSQVGTGEFRNLTANIPPLGAAHRLIRSFGFSGDGADIWFSTAIDPVLSRKMLIPLAGGAPRAFLAEGAAAPSWSADGSRLAYFNNALNDALFIADRSAGDPRQIDIRPIDLQQWTGGAERTHTHNPAWSPDDQWLYFTHGTTRSLNWTDEMDVWRVRSTGGAPERLTDQKASVTFLAPIDARTLLYVARDQDGSGPWLWALDVQSKATQRVTWGLEQYTSVSASRDGRRVVATVVTPSANLWSVPILDRTAEDRDVQPYPVPTVRALAPRFRDTSLFYLSARGTADGLWRRQDGQAQELRKGVDGAMFEPAAISRDGSRVALVHVKDRRRRLAIMSVDGTGFHGVAESLDVQGTIDWSPDGAWIVAGGRDDAQGQGLFKIPVDGGRLVRLVEGQAFNPVWAPDGTLIVYAGALVTGQIAPLIGVTPDGGRVDLPVLQVRPGGHRFLPDGSGLVYLPRNRTLDFWLLDLATRKSRQLTRLVDQDRLGTFDISPFFDITADGKHIVFDRSREASDIVLIDLQRE